MKLSEVGEFGFIDRIAAKTRQHADILIGIGDDAAATLPRPGAVLLTTSDMLVEGIHFDLAFTDPRTLGRKALAVNLSDIAAMGGAPRYALLSLAIPPTLAVEFLDAFIDGVLERAEEFGATLIGGDTCAARDGFCISVTLMGEQLPERVISRGGAKPGDQVFVTGTLGDAAWGLELLRQGERAGHAIGRQLDPVPRVREGLALAEAGIPSAMIDVSDGLLADLGHILERSGSGARLWLPSIPLSTPLQEATRQTSADPYQFPLAGGEDYELLFTAPAEKSAAIAAIASQTGTPITRIGEVTAESGLVLLTADGSRYLPKKWGYNHFALEI